MNQRRLMRFGLKVVETGDFRRNLDSFWQKTVPPMWAVDFDTGSAFCYRNCLRLHKISNFERFVCASLASAVDAPAQVHAYLSRSRNATYQSRPALLRYVC